jgi:FAD/FMN-containing dehydrogenase
MGVDIDATTSTARLAGGARAADVAAATDPPASLPATELSATSVWSLTLSGGYGWLNSIAGLALDNLIRRRSARRWFCGHRERRARASLFRAIRGGGGNFGVVTEMTSSSIRFRYARQA